MTHTICALLDRTGAAALGLAGLLMALGILIAWPFIREAVHECPRCADPTPEDDDLIDLARRNS
jgi:hypothetical protein